MDTKPRSTTTVAVREETRELLRRLAERLGRGVPDLVDEGARRLARRK